MKENWLNNSLCTGCGACVDRCPTQAISMTCDDNGCRKPDIDTGKCISCNLCKNVCPNINTKEYSDFEKSAYVGVFLNKSINAKSASGGLFAALAKHVFSKMSGVVYGAAMVCENDILKCKHIRIERESDLYRIQGTKYIQSHTAGVYKQVKSDLKSGRYVLFSGTSCQVAGLKNFIGDSDHLFTVDLVCHGVPLDKIFYDYISYLENKFHGRAVDISFRSKEISYHGKKMPYVVNIKFNSGISGTFNKCVVRPKSAFYSLFMSRAGYRSSCYECKYASLHKPSDLTLGDFRPNDEEMIEYGFNKSEVYSSIIVHSRKGANLIEDVASVVKLWHVDMSMMLMQHLNLQNPSTITDEGKKLYAIYENGGFRRLQRYILMKNVVLQYKYIAKKLLKEFNLK